MAQSYPLPSSSSPSSSSLSHCGIPIASFSFADSSLNLKLPYFPSSLNLSLISPHSKTLPHAFKNFNSLSDAEFDDPHAKSSSFSKTSNRFNRRSPRPKHLRYNSDEAKSPLPKLAKSLDSCNPTEENVSEILKPLGDNISGRNAVVILNAMVNPYTALLAVKYLQQKVQPETHVILYNVTLKLFRDARDYAGAEKLFDEMLRRRVKPDVITFSTIISCASVCSLPHKAVKWFEKMRQFGCEPDSFVLSSMIFAYARTGNADKAMKLYDRAKAEKWRLDTAVFSALIKMHGMSGNYDGCLNVYNDMKVFGIKPNMLTYNTLLYAMGRAKRAWNSKTIYEDMLNDGFTPNWQIYSALLQAYCRARFRGDALGVYKEMRQKGMDVDLFLYNLLFDMCADVGCVDEAVEMFVDMKSSGTCQPDHFTYASLINMYACFGKISEAEALLNEMMESGFQPNIIILTSLVHCYGKAKRADGVVKTFNQLLDLGISPDDRFCHFLLYAMTQIPEEELGKITVCIEKANPKLGSVIRYLTEKREDAEGFRKEATKLFNSLVDDVKRSTCNCLIDLCLKLGVPDRARDLLDLGLTLEIYPNLQSRSQSNWSLHLRRLSVGASLTALHVWINDLSKALESGEDLPLLLGINTGQGKDKVVPTALETYLKELKAPFRKAADKAGWFLTTREPAVSWLQSWGSTEMDTALSSKVIGVSRESLPH
ncbi:pentatricopeptide repeat-containing protein At4g16390, chloroplastic-like [Abrus precatorius]|uniref:Pentatricopeptide repeat-containing protein At4g16390, chloroplastic-like n=1 Tax=Abrus precatorius TaxID=3816 RepID=A0A8B8K4I3_ABRPR|nr:pentatricopeptide repeat-containing protein At4g16390, chloroplastic-like [Abrus precatorius]